MMNLLGSIFLMGFVWGMFKPCIDHKESEKEYMDWFKSNYEGSGSR